MNKSNLQQKLFDSGLIEKGDIVAINAFKKKHQSEYTKEYNTAYREKTVRKTLIFTISEFEYLEAQAKISKLKLSPFLKAIIFAYLKKTFVFLEKETLSDIEVLLREMNGRIAESIQYVHLSNEVSLKDIEQIKQSIFELEKSITQTLHHPPSLDFWIQNHQVNDNLFVSKLLESIAKFLTKNR